MRSFLLDIKPGFEDDPTRAVYNHVWLIGDASAIGGEVQAEIDELAELTEVGPGAGGPVGEGQAAAPTSPDRRRAGDSEPEPAAPTEPGQEGEAVSEAERPDRLAPGRAVTVEDIRALAGPATPHFALQIRNRIRRLIEPLPEGDPVRAEGERADRQARGARQAQRRPPRHGPGRRGDRSTTRARSGRP